MRDYKHIFEARGASSVLAHRMCPGARDNERRLLIDQLDISAAQRVCDVPAGDGFVSDGIVKHARSERMPEIVCVEPTTAFASKIDPLFEVVIAPLDAIELADRSVDRVASLAGLHHTENKAAFFAEAKRILKTGGRIAVADVMLGTPVAGFLNDSVDRLTDTGHDGMFFAPGDMTTLLGDAGFTSVEEHHHTFTWDFPSWEALVWFCKHFFGLVKADYVEVECELTRYFDIKTNAAGVHLPWSLVYASAVS